MRFIPRVIPRGAARRLVNRLGMRLGQRTALTRLGLWLLAIVVLAIGVIIWDLRQDALAEALVGTDNLAIVLAEQTSRSVQVVDIVLRDIQERIAALGVATPADFRRVLQTREMHDFLRGRADRLPQVDNIALVGADGIRVNYSLGWPAPPVDMSDREYTRHFIVQDDRGLFISEPVVNRATYVWSLYLVRRVNGPHGEFLGMVLGSIPLSTFHDLFQSINLPASESLMLLRRDGTVLARHPDPVNRAGAKIPATSAWYAQVAQGGGHYDSTGIFDAQERIVALRLLRDYPLVMDVALSKDAALATWRRQAILISLGTIFGGVCLFLLLYALGRQFRRLEQQRAALQASEASVVSTSRELQTTLASMDQGLVMIDAGGTVVVCNPRAIELLELEPEQMAHRPRIDAVPPLRSLIDGVARQASTTQDGAALTDASHAPHVYERKLPGGQIIEVHAGRLASAGGWIATFADITARRHAEQQIVFAEAESRAKSGFLAMMSHEIRTPMNGVPGLAGALFDTQLTEQQARMVAAIHDSGNALLRILNDILDFSKLDAGQMQLEGSPFSVATLTQDPVSLLAPKAAAKGLTISTVCDDGLPAALLGDAGRLRQVLLNLVSNAIKFTQNGSVTVRAACPERDEHAATIVWTVTDTGIGIPPDHIAGLFGEFFQADASISRRFGGSGLGLAISKRLIEQMGGKIAVRSQPGMGSTFEVTLRLPITAPAHVEEAAPADVTATFETRLRRLGRPARILFAEDNQTNQFVALQLLKGFTVQVDVAGNGLEAVAAAAQTAYDVICMDMNMPDMDGLAATREIRALPGPIRLVPIIALTANAFPEDVRACRDAGMDLFLAKPVSKQGLVAALLRAIGDGVAPAGAAAPDAGCDPGCDKMALGALAEDIGGANVAELVNLFITETQARFRRIASLGADKAGLGQEIHALKGTAGTVFATRLAGCAAALDRRLRAGGSMEQAEFDALKSAFDSYLTEVGDVHRLQPSAA